MPGPVVHNVRGKPWSKLADVPLNKAILMRLGRCLVKSIVTEAKIDFAKRGWSGTDHRTGVSIFKSFHFHIKNGQDLEISSTYPDIEKFLEGSPRRRMTWLTQQAKESHPGRYRLTRLEKRHHMKRAGHLSQGERMPLLVPIVKKDGEVIVRTAPLTFGNAWVHPGIAKFLFVQRAIRKGRRQCAEILREYLLDEMVKGNPFK